HAVLGVHHFRFARVDSKKCGVKGLCSLKHTASPDVMRIVAYSRGLIGRGLKLAWFEERDGFLAGQQVLPELPPVSRAGKTARHADNGHAVQRIDLFRL